MVRAKETDTADTLVRNCRLQSATRSGSADHCLSQVQIARMPVRTACCSQRPHCTRGRDNPFNNHIGRGMRENSVPPKRQARPCGTIAGIVGGVLGCRPLRSRTSRAPPRAPSCGAMRNASLYALLLVCISSSSPAGARTRTVGAGSLLAQRDPQRLARRCERAAKHAARGDAQRAQCVDSACRHAPLAASGSALVAPWPQVAPGLWRRKWIKIN